MKDRVLDSIVIESVDEAEVERILKSLKESSSGWDAICSKIVKTTYKYFLTPLTHIMNISLLSGVFPSELKIAGVIPRLRLVILVIFQITDQFLFYPFSLRFLSD